MTSMDIAALVAKAASGSDAASSPEDAIHAIVKVFHASLGDRQAHLRPEALRPGQQQFFVAGAFMITPDREKLMLVGNVGFPSEQKRLLVPIDGGNPGQVVASGEPLLIEDTTTRSDFRQYLSTSRMSSALYAPLKDDGRTFGLLLMAAQARWTFGEADLDALTSLSSMAGSVWFSRNGPSWLAEEYSAVTTAPKPKDP